MLLKILSVLFICSLVLGQFGGVKLFAGGFVYLHDLILGILLIVFFIQKSKSLNNLKGQLIKPTLLFMSAGLIALLINTQQFSNVQLFFGSLYLIRYFMYFLLYIFVVNTDLNIKFWQVSLYIASIAFAILGLIQYFFFPSLRSLMYLGWDEHLYRLFSTLLDPNFMGVILVLGFLLGFSLYSKFTKHFYITQGIIGIALWLTASRSAFLALIAGLTLFFFITKNRTLIIVGMIGIVAVFFIPLRGIDTNKIFRINSSIARIENFQQGIQTFKNSPIIGIGFNNLRALSSREKMLDLNGIISRDAAGVNSSILFVLITTGIIGGGLYFYLVFKMIELLKNKQQSIKAIGLATISALAVHSLFNNSLFYPWVMIWTWILWGSFELKKSNIKR